MVKSLITKIVVRSMLRVPAVCHGMRASTGRPTRVRTLCQPIPGAATSAVQYQVAFFQKLAEVLLERVPTRAGQRNYIADGDASVFACILEDFHGQFGYGR